MVASILQFLIRADSSQATGEIKRTGVAMSDLGKTTGAVQGQFDVSEKNFLRVARSLGVDLTGSTQKSIDKLQGLRTHLISTGAPASDLDRVNKALANSQKQYNDLLGGGTGKLGTFGASLSSVKNIAAGVGLTFGALKIAEVIGDGVQAAMDFDREWSKVSVILRNRPPEELDQLKEQIFALPPALGTASESASALYQIISSGVTEPQAALQLLRNAAIAAKGGFTETSTAAAAGTAIMAAYGKTVDQSRNIFDVMAKTVDIGVVTFEQLASELGNVTPIAAANGVSFEELSAAVAQSTLVTNNAGASITGLRSTLNSLISPSEQAKKIAAELGIQWDANILQTKGLAGTIKQLEGNNKISSETIAVLTGRIEAQNFVTQLLSRGTGELVKSTDELKRASDGAGGSVESLRKRSESISFQFDILMNSSKNLAIQIGNFLSPAVSGLLKLFNLLGPTIKAAITGDATTLVKIFSGEYTKMLDDAALGTEDLGKQNDKLNSTIKPLINSGDRNTKSLKDQEEAAKKAKQAFEALGSQFGLQLGPSIRKLTEDGTKWYNQMKDQGATAGELELALTLITDRIGKAADAANTITQRFGDWSDSSERQLELLGLLVDATDNMRAANIALANTEDPMISNNETLKATEAHIGDVLLEWDKLNEKMGVETPEAIKPVKQSFEDLGEVWKKQVSTIVTDFGKGIADIIFQGGNFKDKIVGIFKEIGESIARMFIEFGVSKIIGALTGKGSAGGAGGTDSLSGALGEIQIKFKGVIDGIGDWFKDLGGKIGGALSNIGTKITDTLGKLGSLAAGAGAIFGGMQVGGLAGGGIGAAGGALLGFSLGGPVGAAIGAVGGFFAGLFGKDREKIEDTQIAQKGFAEIWKLHAAYQQQPKSTIEADFMSRSAILTSAIGHWNDMVGAFNRPESRDTQRFGIIAFIDAINKEFSNRTGRTAPSDLPIQPLASGGIVTRPTLALIGERGPEAIVPLDKGMGMRDIVINIQQVVANDPKEFINALKNNRHDLKGSLRRELGLAT